MNPQTRRIIAYIVARLAASAESNALYDYQESSYFNFSGQVTSSTVNVLDYSTSTYIKGTAQPVPGRKDFAFDFDLFYFAKSRRLQLRVEKSGDEIVFEGLDRTRPVRFHGTASTSGNVSFYDSSTGRYYKLKL